MDSLLRFVRQLSRNAAKRTGQKTQDVAPRQTGGQHAASLNHSQIMTLPETPLAPIQDMDPDSDTFGDFLFMVDYDGLDEAPLG